MGRHKNVNTAIFFFFLISVYVIWTKKQFQLLLRNSYVMEIIIFSVYNPTNNTATLKSIQ